MPRLFNGKGVGTNLCDVRDWLLAARLRFKHRAGDVHVKHWCLYWQNCFYTSMLTLFESRYTTKGRYNISNVGKTAYMSILTLFESRYNTLKGRYNIGNVGKTASTSMLTLFESRYTLKGRYNIVNVGKTASMSILTLFESRSRYNIVNVGKITASMSIHTLFESRYTLKERYNIGNDGQTASMSTCLLSLNQYIH